MFKEKLHKNLVKALVDLNMDAALALQQTALPKINSGADVIITGEAKTGKTTLAQIICVQRLNYAFEDAPRALVIVPDDASVEAFCEKFRAIAHYTDLRITAVTEQGKIDKQTDAIYFGTDVVVGTTKRLVEIYLKRTFNITKLKLFIIDDAGLIAKQNVSSQLERLSLSLPKCQRIVFCDELTEKVEKLVTKFSEKFITIN